MASLGKRQRSHGDEGLASARGHGAGYHQTGGVEGFQPTQFGAYLGLQSPGCVDAKHKSRSIAMARHAIGRVLPVVERRDIRRPQVILGERRAAKLLKLAKLLRPRPFVERFSLCHGGSSQLTHLHIVRRDGNCSRFQPAGGAPEFYGVPCSEPCSHRAANNRAANR